VNWNKINLKNIDEELNRVECLRKSAGVEKFFSNRQKQDREWWVLGKASKILMQSGDCDCLFALAAKPPLPDFQILKDDGSLSHHIEIGESLKDGRRRNSEMKERLARPNPWGRSVHVIDDPFISFRKLISKKFCKPYGSGCWLIVYFNISGLEMPEHYSIPWSQMVFNEVNSWSNNELSPVISSCPFDRVLVLDSGGQSLVSIFPRLEVIVEEAWVNQ